MVLDDLAEDLGLTLHEVQSLIRRTARSFKLGYICDSLRSVVFSGVGWEAAELKALAYWERLYGTDE